MKYLILPFVSIAILLSGCEGGGWTIGKKKKEQDPVQPQNTPPEYWKFRIKFSYHNEKTLLYYNTYYPPKPEPGHVYPSDYVRKNGEMFQCRIKHTNTKEQVLDHIVVQGVDLKSDNWGKNFFSKGFNVPIDSTIIYDVELKAE